MRLALQMGRPWKRLAVEMDADELTDWLAYDQVHGLPDPWLQTGVVAATARNVMTAKGQALRPEEFIPADRAGRSARQSPREIRATVRRIAAACPDPAKQSRRPRHGR